MSHGNGLTKALQEDITTSVGDLCNAAELIDFRFFIFPWQIHYPILINMSFTSVFGFASFISFEQLFCHGIKASSIRAS